jgi:hypothetical protein
LDVTIHRIGKEKKYSIVSMFSGSGGLDLVFFSVATVRPDTFLENTTHRSGGPPLPTTDKGALYAAV